MTKDTRSSASGQSLSDLNAIPKRKVPLSIATNMAAQPMPPIRAGHHQHLFPNEREENGNPKNKGHKPRWLRLTDNAATIKVLHDKIDDVIETFFIHTIPCLY